MKPISLKPAHLRIALLLLGISVAGCSSTAQRSLDTEDVKKERLLQQQNALEEAYRQNSRLQRLAFPLLQTATTQCGEKVKPKLGLQLHTANDYSSSQREAAVKAFGPLDGIRIKDVIEGAPAQGKLLPGDRLLLINGEQVTESSRGTAQQLRNAMSDDLTVRVEVEREGTEIALRLNAVALCDYPVILSRRDAINAFADGDTIVINEGLIRFAQADKDLALIIAHELAHNVIDHRADKIRDGLIGGLFDIAISLSGNMISPGIGVGLGANLLSQEYEIEADILAIRLMHQQGYAVASLPEFWRKMASVHPSSIHHGNQASHPTTVERYLIMKKEVEHLTQSEKDTPLDK
ncbi:M48 family metallopeptidase [Pontibacterium granulatum]|uniref:M48 family metallopeptidase n=1 Tax=Pontibacterium granulatum TaxID=2036029 RepID=UPI00249C5CC1|nr:M48 family metallopeptidase [Pontibacterium granulatum]MDI3325474.1 M48 family metallopeptidase [Pontibacterium granulatum]